MMSYVSYPLEVGSSPRFAVRDSKRSMTEKQFHIIDLHNIDRRKNTYSKNTIHENLIVSAPATRNKSTVL